VDFKFEQVKKLEDGSYAPVMAVIMDATHKDHNDIHYLYKLRKALVLLVGEEGLAGFNSLQLEEIHSGIVKNLIGQDKSHWYDDYCDLLDETLPEDLKEKSDGYYKPENKGMFNLEDESESIYFSLLEKSDCKEVWLDLDNREDSPIDYFLDTENRRYPYRNNDGSINTKALSVLCDYFNGRGGAVKRPLFGARAKRLFVKITKE
jgi:hypothetical protein